MLLSVITVCFNDRPNLARTLESIKSQGNQEFEWVVIDGGSTDGTIEMLERAKMPQLKWVSQPDSGIYDAMNKGARLATGDYVYFLNAGDCFYSPEVLTRLAEVLKSRRPDFLYGKVKCVGNGIEYLKGHQISIAEFKLGMPICHQAALYRRDRLPPKPYDDRFTLIADYILTRNLMRNSNYVEFFDDLIAIYDLGGVSSRQHFLILSERLKLAFEERSFGEVFVILFLLYPKYLLIQLLRRISVYTVISKGRDRNRSNL